MNTFTYGPTKNNTFQSLNEIHQYVGPKKLCNFVLFLFIFIYACKSEAISYMLNHTTSTQA